jgi:hypothetical protein
LPLVAGEQNTGGEVRDGDGRLIVVGPGGVAIGGGGGGTASTVALDAATLAALETISVANLLNPHPVSIAAALDIADRGARLLGHVTVDAAPTTAVTGPLTDAQLRASAVPVSGTFFQATQPVSGTVSVANFPATQAVTGTVTSTTARAGTGTASSVASTVTTNTTILAANANRFGASIYNESTAVLFLLLGAGTESATVYTLQMAAGSYYETPFGFTGIIKGHWASANGSARIVEYT